jgi:hypothetical protein
VNCKSLKDQGVDRLPQPKLGKAHHMEQCAEWAGKTDAGDRWRETQQINALKAEEERLRQEREAIARQAREALQRHAYELGQTLVQEDAKAARRREDDAPHPKTHQSADQVVPKPPPEPQTATGQDGEKLFPDDQRSLIEQWQQFHDRERDKSRATGQHDPASPLARDTSPQQQTIQLTEAMAVFGAEEETREQSKHATPEAKAEQRRREEERAREAERQRQQHQPRGHGR